MLSLLHMFAFFANHHNLLLCHSPSSRTQSRLPSNSAPDCHRPLGPLLGPPHFRSDSQPHRPFPPQQLSSNQTPKRKVSLHSLSPGGPKTPQITKVKSAIANAATTCQSAKAQSIANAASFASKISITTAFG